LSPEFIARWLERPLKPFVVADVPELGASVGTTIGDVRSENQDRAIVARFTSLDWQERSFTCFIICDGMGGMADGSRCAEIATSAFLHQLVQPSAISPEERVRSSALAANASVNTRYRERGGTTLTAIVEFLHESWAVNVGDSRIYELARGKEFKQVTTDDTIAGELDKLKELAPTRSGWDTFASQLAQFVGIGAEIEPRLIRINRDSIYLLTSDGVHGYGLNPGTFKQIAVSAPTSQALVSRLLQLSRWRGGTDNASAISTSPFRPEHLKPAAWSSGDYLEVWDSAGKLEIPVQQKELAYIPVVQRTAPSFTEEPRIRRSRSGRSKGQSTPQKSSQVPAGPTTVQSSLKIEIVDQEPREQQFQSVHPNEAPPKQNGAVEPNLGRIEVPLAASENTAASGNVNQEQNAATESPQEKRE
jgi:serine/threonine protein phosphatase PrpC